MLNGSINYRYSGELISALGTFGGALAGAGLAGYISTRLFDKNIKHEEEKKEKEQDIKKLILLNDYLKESYEIMGLMRYLVDDYMKKAKEIKFPTPWEHDMVEELRVYNGAFEFFLRKSDQLIHEIDVLNKNLNNVNFDSVLDVDFRERLRNHRFLLKDTKTLTLKIKEKNSLKNHFEVWEYLDIIANMMKFDEAYSDFEMYLYESKK